MCMNAYMHTHIATYVHTYIHVHTYTHIPIHTYTLYQNMDTEQQQQPGEAGGADEVGVVSVARGGVSESVAESCRDLRESLDHVAGLLGRLSLSWRVMETQLEGERDNSWVVGERLETFLRDQVQFPFSGSHDSIPWFSHTAEPRSGRVILPRSCRVEQTEAREQLLLHTELQVSSAATAEFTG